MPVLLPTSNHSQVRRCPINRGQTFFLRAGSLLDKGESTHRFDCNTVGPVPVASGYGSRTLTQSAAHLLKESKENASALSFENEKRLVQSDNGLWALSETEVKDPKRFSDANGRPTKGSDAEMVEAKKSGAMPKSCHFTLWNNARNHILSSI